VSEQAPEAFDRFSQLSRLVSLYDEELKSLWGMRAARAMSVSIFLSTALLMLFVSTLGGAADVDLVVLRGLVGLSWLVGGSAALSAARNMALVPTAIDGLAALQGVKRNLTELAVLLAVAKRTMLLLFLPASLLAFGAISLSTDVRSGVLGVALTVGVLGYCLVLSFSLAALASLCSRLSSKHQQGWLLGLVLLPEAARLWRPNTLSLPAVSRPAGDADGGVGKRDFGPVGGHRLADADDKKKRGE
jgi:hypothetical protein